MIYDAFIFFNELDLLEIRLGILDPVVDFFILSESPYTFTNIPKPLYYTENKARFKPWEHKIIHIIDNSRRSIHPWHNEHNQRNSLKLPITAKSKHDIVMLSDIDEIPYPSRIQAFNPDTGMELTQMTLYYYFLNTKKSNCWWGTVMMSGYIFDPMMPQHIRELRIHPDLPDQTGGWHYSYLGGHNMCKQKLKAFSETQDQIYINTISNHINTAIDHITGLPLTLDNSNIPQYVSQNISKFKHLLSP